VTQSKQYSMVRPQGALFQYFRLPLLSVLSSLALEVNAASFGTFDPRALSMGGATVAAGSSSHAHFYNPALLSFENEDEDYSRNGRFVFPGVTALISDAGQSAADIVADDLDEQITNAVNQYNAAPADVAAQQGVLNALVDFDDAIETLNQQVIEVEAHIGLAVTEPSDREGGSFYFGVRGLVFGQANVSDADLNLIDDYINALQTVVAGGDPSTIGGGVFNGANLVDPRPSLTSQVQVSSLAIGEWGIAMSKEFNLWGQGVAFGLTPKIMQVEVYREDVNFVDDTPSYGENKKSHLTMNLDLGAAADIFDHYRVGVSIRDILPKTFASENGLEVQLEPRARLGLAYFNDYVTVGFDIDMIKNKPYASEPESQDLALGVELSPWDVVDLRFGYRQDFGGERSDILSAGVRYQIWRFVGEAAVATGDDIVGGSIQLGWAF